MAATEKQLSVLLRANYQLQEVKSLSRDQVSQLIDLVRTNGWRRLDLQQLQDLIARRDALLSRAGTSVVKPVIVDERLDRLFRRSGAYCSDDDEPRRLLRDAETAKGIGSALIAYRQLCDWGKWRAFLQAIGMLEEVVHEYINLALPTCTAKVKDKFSFYYCIDRSTAGPGERHILELLLDMERAKLATTTDARPVTGPASPAS